jgi:hypothetical protein
MTIDTQALTQQLWPQGNLPDSHQVYALLDGARDEAIAPAVWLSKLPQACLYAGELSPALQRAAPYLVQLAPESRFTARLLAEGFGQAWGIFVVAPPDVSLALLRKHFRTFLRVQDEAGKGLLFRYYDPRVLRAYLPTCTGDERRQVFGPAARLCAETPDGLGLITYTPDGREQVFACPAAAPA